MWKKDETGKNAETAEELARTSPGPGTSAAETGVGVIGKSILVNGELRGSEDLRVDGSVVGTVELRNNVLTVGPTGAVEAQTFARQVIVLGSVHGGITAGERVEIRHGGSVEGTIVSPRVAIADGAHFRGKIEMERGGPGPAHHGKPPQSSEPVRPEGQARPAALAGS
jgi:cytoskeletal protein CcmA (bactofilin family)